MRRSLVVFLATGVLGTVASNVRAQDAAPTASTAPGATPVPPAPAAPAASPAKAEAPVATNSPAGDQPVPETGWELAARISFSLPTGDLSGILLGAMPFQIDAGRRLSKQLIVGVYGYAAVIFPIVGTAYGLGFGAEGQYF